MATNLQFTDLDVSGLSFVQMSDVIRFFYATSSIECAFTKTKEKARLFVSACNRICQLNQRSSKMGRPLDANEITDFSIIRIKRSLTQAEKQAVQIEKNRKLITKLQKAAKKATFSNKFIRQVLAADPTKSMYVNKIGTGSKNEGSFISVERICKALRWEAEAFLRALAAKQPYKTRRFDMDGYEVSVSLDINHEGDFCGFLDKEFKDCLNGYYYLLINDSNFMMYEKD